MPINGTPSEIILSGLNDIEIAVTAQEAVHNAVKTAIEAVQDVAEAVDDAVADAGAAGSIHSKLRRLTADIGTLVTILDTGVLEDVKTAVEGIQGVAEAVGDEAVAAGAEGSIHAKLRRISADMGTLVTTLTDGTDKAIQAAVEGVQDVVEAVDEEATEPGAAGGIHAKLRRLTADIGSLVTGTILAAGTAIVGWFQIKRLPIHTYTTVVGATIYTLNPRAPFELLGIRIHVGSALAAAETLTVTLNCQRGAEYDTVLYTLDMGTPDIRDLVIPFGGDEDFFSTGDQIVIALSANAGADTVGCETIHELI